MESLVLLIVLCRFSYFWPQSDGWECLRVRLHPRLPQTFWVNSCEGTVAPSHLHFRPPPPGPLMAAPCVNVSSGAVSAPLASCGGSHRNRAEYQCFTYSLAGA